MSIGYLHVLSDLCWPLLPWLEIQLSCLQLRTKRQSITRSQPPILWLEEKVKHLENRIFWREMWRVISPSATPEYILQISDSCLGVVIRLWPGLLDAATVVVSKWRSFAREIKTQYCIYKGGQNRGWYLYRTHWLLLWIIFQREREREKQFKIITFP